MPDHHEAKLLCIQTDHELRTKNASVLIDQKLDCSTQQAGIPNEMFLLRTRFS